MNKNNAKGIGLMLFCSFCLSGGQMVWKLMPGFNWFYIMGGFLLYGIGAVSMLAAYRYGELSVLQPINSMSYVYALFIGYFIFHEGITRPRVAGVIFVIFGVLLLGKGSSR
jgi:undecaprenyl phosphate-alpha-L-ara4N flippase subunit ArnE